MQQQVNQAMLQFAAGFFGGQHLKEQKKQSDVLTTKQIDNTMNEFLGSFYKIKGSMPDEDSSEWYAANAA